MTRSVLASLLALGVLSAAAAAEPKTPQVVNYTPFPATLAVSQGPRTPIFSMILKMTMKRNPDGSWQFDQEQEPLMKFFSYSHLPAKLQAVSESFAYLACRIMDLPRSAERTVALRKLLESKDAAVRAAL